jgi:hypothetical protein
MRHIAVSRAYRDREFRISGIVDREHESSAGGAGLGAERSVSRVSGGDHHHHAGADQAVDFDTDRTLSAGEPSRIEFIAQAQIDAVNEVLTAVIVDTLHRVERRDDACDVALSPVVQHFMLTILQNGAMPVMFSIGWVSTTMVWSASIRLRTATSFGSLGASTPPAMMPATCVP